MSDKANILSSNTESKIESICADIRSRLGYNVYVATAYSLEGKTSEEYADDLYDSIFPLNSDGIIFLVSMEGRDYWLSTSGNAISTLYDDDRLDKIEDAVLTHLKSNDFDGAALTFASLTDSCLTAVSNYGQDKLSDPDNAWQNSYDEEINDYWVKNEKAERRVSIFKKLIISLIIAVIVAFIWVSVMKAGMNNVRQQKRAADYVRKGSFRLTQSSDLFLYSTVAKTPKAQSSSSGGGTHTGSSGASHGGSGGKF